MTVQLTKKTQDELNRLGVTTCSSRPINLKNCIIPLVDACFCFRLKMYSDIKHRIRQGDYVISEAQFLLITSELETYSQLMEVAAIVDSLKPNLTNGQTYSF